MLVQFLNDMVITDSCQSALGQSLVNSDGQLNSDSDIVCFIF